MKERTYLPIKCWAPEDRPREKLIKNGAESLTNAELLAVLLRSGTFSCSALELSQDILRSAGNDLSKLAKMSVHDFRKFDGIGAAKGLSVVSAFELGRRRGAVSFNDKEIVSAGDVFDFMSGKLIDKSFEEFWVLLLKANNRVMCPVLVSSGGTCEVTVDSKMIFKIAIENLSQAIIVIHNHPSGSLEPSLQDRSITREISDYGNLLKIPLLDHVIIAEGGYFSFRDKGLL